jgi:hypothetical protein
MKGAEWEFITNETVIGDIGSYVSKTERLPVPGGWLYRNILLTKGFAPKVEMIFVPVDPTIPEESTR